MKIQKNIIVAALCFVGIMLAVIFAREYVEFQESRTLVSQPVAQVAQSKEKPASEMNETETIRHLMSQIYRSTEFIPDEAEQLPNAWNETIKNRLLWKPTEKELVLNPDWAEVLKRPSRDGAPLGYFIASPMLFHTYDAQGVTYAYLFAQTATNGYAHVSGADIGAGVFKKEDGVWKSIFISKNINNGVGASGDAGTMSLLKIGKDKYAYKNEMTNSAQGAIFYHKEFFYFNGNTFVGVLSLLAHGSDGTDCMYKDMENEWSETIDIWAEPVQGSELDDLVVMHGGTTPEGSPNECRIIPIKKKIEIYRWGGVRYELVK